MFQAYTYCTTTERYRLTAHAKGLAQACIKLSVATYKLASSTTHVDFEMGNPTTGGTSPTTL